MIAARSSSKQKNQLLEKKTHLNVKKLQTKNLVYQNQEWILTIKYFLTLDIFICLAILILVGFTIGSCYTLQGVWKNTIL